MKKLDKNQCNNEKGDDNPFFCFSIIPMKSIYTCSHT